MATSRRTPRVKLTLNPEQRLISRHEALGYVFTRGVETLVERDDVEEVLAFESRGRPMVVAARDVDEPLAPEAETDAEPDEKATT